MKRYGNGVVRSWDWVSKQLAGKPSLVDPSLAAKVAYLLQQTLKDDPSSRPSVKEVLEMPLMLEVGKLQADLQQPQLLNRFMEAFVSCRPEYRDLWQQQQQFLTQQPSHQQQQPRPTATVAFSEMQADVLRVESGNRAKLSQQVVKLAPQPGPAAQQPTQQPAALPVPQQQQLFGSVGDTRRDMVRVRPGGLIQINVPLAIGVVQQQQQQQHHNHNLNHQQ